MGNTFGEVLLQYPQQERGNPCQNFEITTVFEKHKSKWADLIKEEVQEKEEATRHTTIKGTTVGTVKMLDFGLRRTILNG